MHLLITYPHVRSVLGVCHTTPFLADHSELRRIAAQHGTALYILLYCQGFYLEKQIFLLYHFSFYEWHWFTHFLNIGWVVISTKSCQFDTHYQTFLTRPVPKPAPQLKLQTLWQIESPQLRKAWTDTFFKIRSCPLYCLFPNVFSNNAIFKHINWHLQNTCTCNCRDWHNLSSRASSLDHHYHYQRQVKRRCHSKLHEEFICTNCFNRICVQQNSNIANTGITNLSI